MRQKRKTSIGFGLALLLLLCCLLPLAFFEGTLLPFKPCRPITYVDGKKISSQEGEFIIQTTSDSLDEVLAFYEQELPAQEYNRETYEFGQWTIEEMNDHVLYSCYGRDINGLTTETGCVYVSSIREETLIEIVRYRSEGSNTPCTLREASKS